MMMMMMTTGRCHCEEGWKGEECNVRLDECEVVIVIVIIAIIITSIADILENDLK